MTVQQEQFKQTQRKTTQPRIPPSLESKLLGTEPKPPQTARNRTEPKPTPPEL